MHTFENPIAPSALAPGWISEKLSGVIMKLLEKHPHNRYTDCHSLLHDLIEVKICTLANYWIQGNNPQ